MEEIKYKGGKRERRVKVDLKRIMSRDEMPKFHENCDDFVKPVTKTKQGTPLYGAPCAWK